MFVSKNTTLQDFEYTQNGEPFEISKDIALDRTYLDFLCSKFQKSKITKYSHRTLPMAIFFSQSTYSKNACSLQAICPLRSIFCFETVVKPCFS